MRVLESLCWFKVRAQIKNRVLFRFNRSPLYSLYTRVSKNVISVSEISVVNFIVGWKLLGSSLKLFIAFCLCSIEKRCCQCIFSSGL